MCNLAGRSSWKCCALLGALLGNTLCGGRLGRAMGAVRFALDLEDEGAVDQPDEEALADARRSRQDQVLPSADEGARSQFFDLDALDGLGVELPIEACQSLEFGEVSLADAARRTALAAQAGL